MQPVPCKMEYTMIYMILGSIHEKCTVCTMGAISLYISLHDMLTSFPVLVSSRFGCAPFGPSLCLWQTTLSRLLNTEISEDEAMELFNK